MSQAASRNLSPFVKTYWLGSQGVPGFVADLLIAPAFFAMMALWLIYRPPAAAWAQHTQGQY